jgi:hypothetical protein
LLLLRKQPPTFWSATVRKFKARFDASRTSQSVGNVLPIRPTADRPQKHEVAKQQHKHDGRKSHTTRVTCFEQKKRATPPAAFHAMGFSTRHRFASPSYPQLLLAKPANRSCES